MGFCPVFAFAYEKMKEGEREKKTKTNDDKNCEKQSEIFDPILSSLSVCLMM